MTLVNAINKEYSPILKYIDGYGIIESCGNNYVTVAYNLLEEEHYKINKDEIYITSIDEPIIQNCNETQTTGLILREAKTFFQNILSINNHISNTVAIF